MAENGASDPLPSAPGRVGLLNRQPTLGTGDGNYSSCPHYGHSRKPPGSAQLGGYLPLAPGVSTVHCPIPQRTFKYVVTVQSVTDETCQKLTSRRLSRGFRPSVDYQRV